MSPELQAIADAAIGWSPASQEEPLLTTQAAVEDAVLETIERCAKVCYDRAYTFRGSADARESLIEAGDAIKALKTEEPNG